MFPLGKTGGLIEALLHSTTFIRVSCMFPLGKTGGLIEARTRQSRRTPRLRRFRWVKPAASLKQADTVARCPAARHEFPLGKTGGLIEAVCETSHSFDIHLVVSAG